MFGHYSGLGAQQRQAFEDQRTLSSMYAFSGIGAGLNGFGGQRAQQRERPLYGEKWINKEVIKEADIVDITDRKLLT